MTIAFDSVSLRRLLGMMLAAFMLVAVVACDGGGEGGGEAGETEGTAQ